MLQFFQEYTRLVDLFFVLSTGIVIAAVSSWITVQLSLRRFRSERWWERKAEAYERIIGGLHDFKIFASRHAEAELQKTELPEKDSQALRARSAAAHDEILKAIDMGAFLLSDEALSTLKQYRIDEQNAKNLNTWFEYLEADWAAADKCLKDLIPIAKRDLRAK